MLYLVGSRYCETDCLSQIAWDLFGWTAPGWSRVDAICQYVNQHIRFGYEYARPTKTASEAFRERAWACAGIMHTWRSRSAAA